MVIFNMEVQIQKPFGNYQQASINFDWFEELSIDVRIEKVVYHAQRVTSLLTSVGHVEEWSTWSELESGHIIYRH